MTTIPNSTVTILGAAATLCFMLPEQEAAE